MCYSLTNTIFFSRSEDYLYIFDDEAAPKILFVLDGATNKSNNL